MRGLQMLALGAVVGLLTVAGVAIAEAATLCNVQLTQATYADGEIVTASVLRLANTEPLPRAMELKIWLEVPGLAPLSVANVGADGSVVLPSGFDQDFGPVTLFTVTPGFPRGTYRFSCRIRDPVTAELLSEDLNPFTIS